MASWHYIVKSRSKENFGVVSYEIGSCRSKALRLAEGCQDISSSRGTGESSKEDESSGEEEGGERGEEKRK